MAGGATGQLRPTESLTRPKADQVVPANSRRGQMTTKRPVVACDAEGRPGSEIRPYRSCSGETAVPETEAAAVPSRALAAAAAAARRGQKEGSSTRSRSSQERAAASKQQQKQAAASRKQVIGGRSSLAGRRRGK